jgi:hypothetical protein
MTGAVRLNFRRRSTVTFAGALDMGARIQNWNYGDSAFIFPTCSGNICVVTVINAFPHSLTVAAPQDL